MHDQRTILQVLEDMPSIKPDIGHFFELLPRLQARFYSISSSPKLHASSIHVTAAVVRYTTPLNVHVGGVCTTFLEALSEGDSVPIYVRASTFRLPPRVQVPVVMIGPGTGIAPFRGFIQVFL